MIIAHPDVPVHKLYMNDKGELELEVLKVRIEGYCISSDKPGVVQFHSGEIMLRSAEVAPNDSDADTTTPLSGRRGE